MIIHNVNIMIKYTVRMYVVQIRIRKLKNEFVSNRERLRFQLFRGL